MSYQNKETSLGLLLQNAGLICQNKLQNALEAQKQYSNMNLGEILVLQAGIRPKTIDFFCNWQEIILQGKQFPLGYYLSKADLLSEQQIKTILQEQQSNKRKFGIIAIEKGWVEPKTIDFFVNSLSLKPPSIISLNQLENYNSNYLHLDKKYANYSLILSRILAWTGGNVYLTKTSCQIFADFDLNIPAGSETAAVDRFIEGSLIKKWRVSKVAEYIRVVKQQLVNNPRCASKLLLEEYRDVLISGSKEYQNTKEQNELILLGLLSCQEDKYLTISNPIYQLVFDRDFISKELSEIEHKFVAAPSSSIENRIKSESKIFATPEQKTSHLDFDRIDRQPQINKTSNSKLKMGIPKLLTIAASLITLGAIALLIPLFLKMNNYYSSQLNQEQEADFSSEADRLQQLCDEIDFSDSSASLSLISQLEKNQQQMSEFPDNCQAALDRLRIVAAPVLGNESRILEAVKQLCKIPEDSEMHLEAKIWLKHWYNSPAWGQKTQLYLEDFNKYKNFECPAARFTQSEN